MFEYLLKGIIYFTGRNISSEKHCFTKASYDLIVHDLIL